MHKIDADIALEIASHEAIVRQTYKDSVGVLTWSVGLTNATGHRVNRYIGKPASMQRCLAVFAWALERYADDVREAFKGMSLSKEQFAAALSFHYNTGAISRAGWVKKFKAGDLSGAKKAFMAWSKPKEIIPRRRKERDLFFSGKWSNDGRITEYTRVASDMSPVWSSAKRVDVRNDIVAALSETENSAPKAMQEVVDRVSADDRVSKTQVGTILLGTSGATATAKQAIDAANEVKDAGNALVSVGPWAILAVAVIGVGVWLYLRREKEKKQARAAREEAVTSA